MATTTMSQQGVRLGTNSMANNLIYGASILSILISLFTVRRSTTLANFFGLWAPTILGLGIMLKENQIQEQLGQHVETPMGSTT